MAFSVVMPALEMAQETGKLIAWRKQEGDRVTKGEPLLEIETDKAVMEVEAPADGILAGVTGSIGTDIPVGRTIAWIVAPGEKVPTENSAGAAAPTARAGSQGKTESHVTSQAAHRCRTFRRSERKNFSESAAARERVGSRCYRPCAVQDRAVKF